MNTITHNILVTVAPSKKFQNQLRKQTRSARGFKVLAVAASDAGSYDGKL